MPKSQSPRRRRFRDEISRAQYMASCVEAALAPLSPYLKTWEVQLVRSIVQASIEADPVSRRLLANALRVRLQSYRKRRRSTGAR